MLTTKTFEVGLLAANCYVINCRDTLQAAIIDPGFGNKEEAQQVISYLDQNGLSLKFILNTHGHPDHTCGNKILKDRYNVPICIHKDDAYMLGESGIETARYFGFESISPSADILLHDGSYVNVGDVSLRVIDAPGHSFGSVVFLGETEVFTGDALFAGSIGRTDFPGSSDREMQLSLAKLTLLPNFFIVYPGHGPSTTIGEEKRVNPFLKRL